MDLISAAKSGQFETVFSLLQDGCSCDIRDKDNATPLYWAACQGHTNVCEILIQAGSDVNSRVTWGSTPLHAAADRGHKAVIEVLLESGADVNAQNTRGDTALHIAAYRGHSDVIMTLLRAKADVRIRNEKGKTPQQEAMEGGHRIIAENIVNYANIGQVSRPDGSRKATTPDEMVPRDQQELKVCVSAGRRMSEVTIPYRAPEVNVPAESEDPDYENAERRQSVPGPLPNFKDVPPPRPPIGRSVSFSGKHDPALNTGTSNQANLQTNSRTHSVPSISYDHQKLLNDVNKSFTSSEFVNRTQAVNLEPSWSQSPSDMTDSSAYSSDYSYRTMSYLSAGGNEPTESSDYSSMFGNSRKVPELPPRSPVQPHRPNRLPVGSVTRDYTDGNDPELVYVLKKQLVESYKQTEKLSAENETLNFKCSTLLSRLTDTEQACTEKARECDSLKELLDKKNKEFEEMNKVIQSLRSRPVINTDITKTGFKKLTDRLSKELADETISEIHEIMRNALLAHAVYKEFSSESLDAPHREWVPGVDYVIVGRQQSEEQQEHTESGLPKHISFLIKHLRTGRRLILMMLLRFRKRGDIQADDFETAEELDILERLSDNPNAVKVLHSYQSSTERFKKFICIPPSQPHNAQEICSRTTFIVTEQMVTLTKFIKSQTSETSTEVLSSFLLHCFYQLLSLLCVFEELGIEHGNIGESSIFINEDLQPVLGGFQMASFNETKTTGTIEGIQQDYVNVEHLVRGPQMHRLPRNFPRRNNDLFALGKFFDNILLDDGSQTHDDVTGSSPLSSTMTSLPAAVWQVLNGIITKFQNFSCRDCLHRVGYSLFGPRKGEVKNQYETRNLMQTQMFKLLAVSPPDKSSNLTENERVRIQDVLTRNRFQMEAHFLCNITAKQLWDMYRMFEKDNLLMG